MRPILVCGCSGQVGGALAAALEARGMPSVGLSRRPPSRTGAREIRHGDFGDPASLSRALEGIGSVFLASGDHPQQDVLETNMIRACRESGIGHIVKLSAQSAALEPPTSFGRLHARSEQVLRESGISWTLLRPVFFMQSLLFFAESIRAGRLIAATGTGRVAWVDVRDVADVAAAVLAEPVLHAARVHTLTGAEATSFGEAAARIGAVAGQTVRHISPPAWLARIVLPKASGMPRWQANLAIELMSAIRGGAQAEVVPDLARVLGRAPRRLDAFLLERRDAFAKRAAVS